MIAIIDYDMGNIMSVEKALNSLGFETLVTNNKKEIQSADKVVLPGVGAFGDTMAELNKRGLVPIIKEEIASGKPFLGICLGLQVLFESSEEAPGVEGLSVIKGKCLRFQTNLKVPHMGWNSIKINNVNPIYKDIPDGSYVYFVHSYYVAPENSDVIATTTNYDGEFVSSICKDNLFATQFHPEKSQEVGLKILKNFGML